MLEELRGEMVRRGWPEPAKFKNPPGYGYSWDGPEISIRLWSMEGRTGISFGSRVGYPRNVGEAAYILEKWQTMLKPGEIPALNPAGCSCGDPVYGHPTEKPAASARPTLTHDWTRHTWGNWRPT